MIQIKLHKFYNDVISLKNAFEEFGNPFCDNSNNLISIGTNIVIDKENVKNLYTVKTGIR